MDRQYFSQGFGQNTQSSISTQNGKSDRVHLVFLRHAKSGRKEKKRESSWNSWKSRKEIRLYYLWSKMYVLRNTSRVVVPELKFNFEVTCVTHAVIHYKLSHLLLTWVLTTVLYSFVFATSLLTYWIISFVLVLTSKSAEKRKCKDFSSFTQSGKYGIFWQLYRRFFSA